MCLYPKLILNPKYKANKKNKGIIPKLKDERAKYVPIGCGQCIECRKQKAREWQVRLSEEIKNLPKDYLAYFVTLTFSEEKYKKLCEKTNSQYNNVAIYAMRHFLERIRKETKKSAKHWFITELGHQGTERIHLHGIIILPKNKGNQWISEKWQYGFVYTGSYVNNRTINYCTKYMLKIDQDHKDYKQIVLASPGIGKQYLNTQNKIINRFNKEKTNETYRLPNGRKMALPIYYRNNIYTDSEKEKLWMLKLDKEERYILGSKVKVGSIEGEQDYQRRLREAQKLNKRLGYGDGGKYWKYEDYNESRKKLSKKFGKEK